MLGDVVLVSIMSRVAVVRTVVARGEVLGYGVENYCVEDCWAGIMVDNVSRGQRDCVNLELGTLLLGGYYRDTVGLCTRLCEYGPIVGWTEDWYEDTDRVSR